jgi:hypothetical protein
MHVAQPLRLRRGVRHNQEKGFVMPAWDELTRLATGGDYARAVQWMDSNDSRLAFDGLFALAVNQPQAFDALWNSVPYGGQKISDFALDLIYDGAMPQREYAEMGWFDYDEAREVYLRAWEKSKRPVTWPKDRQNNAENVCLYPEYVRRQSRRTAIINLAMDHDELGPTSRYQANLFCMGGRYTWSIGKQGANPPKPGTTCMLFARSILNAAGIKAIGPKTPKSCSCDLGLNAELAHLNMYVSTKRSTSMPTPRAGDVFHIEGPPFKGGYGSAHVGVIVKVEGDKWTCVQGGSPTHVTKTVVFTVTRMPGSTTHGTWYFKEDAGVSLASGGKALRGIHGYWNIDALTSQNYMARPG